MPMALGQKAVRLAGVAVKHNSLPGLLTAYEKRWDSHEESYVQLEDHGRAVVEDPTASRLDSFIQRVCLWGNYAGIAGRILKKNTPEDRISAFSVACHALGQDNEAAALTALNGLRDLGTPSFASKHLRFLDPRRCGVLDSVLCEALEYCADPVGYSQFCRDLRHLGCLLSASGIPNPRRRPGDAWFAADVESAVFEHCWRMRNETRS